MTSKLITTQKDLIDKMKNGWELFYKLEQFGGKFTVYEGGFKGNGMRRTVQYCVVDGLLAKNAIKKVGFGTAKVKYGLVEKKKIGFWDPLTNLAFYPFQK